jgi:predicted transcriptional regulator
VEEEKSTYTVQELYDDLPITLVELGSRADLNEVTVARIRDGKPTRRTSVNRLLRALSEVYGKPLSLKNVSGINVQVNKRLEKKEAKRQDNIAVGDAA